MEEESHDYVSSILCDGWYIFTKLHCVTLSLKSATVKSPTFVL